MHYIGLTTWIAKLFKEKLPSDIDISEVKKSKKGYVDGNKNYYIRFIVNDKKWFEENLEKL